MADMFFDDDADLAIIQDARVAIVGFGPQGQAHAMNLRDSGVEVAIALEDGSPSIPRAEEQGFTVMPVADATAWAGLIMMLAPDQDQRAIFTASIAPRLTTRKTLAFAHGFGLRYGLIEAPEGVDVILVAPKAPAHAVRREFAAGRGIPALVAVEQDATGQARATALSYAKAIGATRAGVIATTVVEETETSLFGTQAVLRGGLHHLVQAGFDTLTEAGYSSEVAWLEVIHELTSSVELLAAGGIAAQRRAMSEVAEYGDYVAGPRIITDEAAQAMAAVLADIQDGAFADRFIGDQDAGAPELQRLREASGSDRIDAVGDELRTLFPWSSRGVDPDGIEEPSVH